MGLDMYLDVRRSVYQSDSEETAKLKAFMQNEMSGSCLPNADPSDDVFHIGQRVAYWRKANAIHAWFVNNVQDGVDECQESYVGRKHLLELVEKCSTVLDKLNPVFQKSYDNDEWEGGATDVVSEVAEVLPPCSGFFFGSTDIDMYYYHQVRYTHDRIKELLEWLDKEHSEGRWWYVTYQASW